MKKKSLFLLFYMNSEKPRGDSIYLIKKKVCFFHALNCFNILTDILRGICSKDTKSISLIHPKK
jgi:hypothetical protein